MAYRAGDRRDRWKAIAATAAINLLLGAVILSGLNVEIVSRAVERLETFDLALPKPPPEEPPPPPPPKARDEVAEGAPAAPRASPVVAPRPVVVLPPKNPIPAAPVAGTGSSSSAGQGGAGSGTGAGGSGAGTGRGSGIGRDARLLGGHRARLGFRLLQAAGVRRGEVPLRLTVGAAGRVTACSPLRSSGSVELDAELCRIMKSNSRWSPATDRNGRPTSVELTYIATFSD